MPLEIHTYSKEEITLLISELKILFSTRNEVVSGEVIQKWITALERMANLSLEEIIMKIRVACLKKRYGSTTTLGEILDNEYFAREYQQYYKVHKLTHKEAFGY